MSRFWKLASRCDVLSRSIFCCKGDCGDDDKEQCTLAVLFCSRAMMSVSLQSGGTIEMWQKYFGAGLRMYGVDINPYCRVSSALHVHVLSSFKVFRAI